MKSNQIEVELTNRRRNLLWEKIRNENNYDKNANYFQELFDISEYDDEDEDIAEVQGIRYSDIQEIPHDSPYFSF